MSADSVQLWAVAFILIVIVLTILLWPLVKRRPGSLAAREVYDINVYKVQLQEIEADLERGLLSEDQGEAARTEIKRRMLAAADDTKTHAARVTETGPRSSGLVIAAIALIVPLGAVMLYLNLGEPNEPDRPLAERKADAVIAQAEQQHEIMQATAKLAKHLEQNPDDLRGWMLLGRTYLNQELYDEAVNAFAGAYKASSEDPEIGADYAEVLTMAAESVVTPEAYALFRKALETDSLNPKARYYLGMAAAQQGDVRGAMQEWVDLAVISPSDAPWRQVLDQQIQRASQESGIDPATIEPSPQAKVLAEKVREATQRAATEAAAAQSADAPGPTNEDVKAAMGLSEGDRSEMIRGMVQRLADRMKETPDDRDGWIRLERAYRVLGDEKMADEAAAKAAALAAVPPAAPQPRAVAPGPTNEDVKAAMGLSEGDRSEMIRSMVQRLADRMKENPDDKDGWIRLERAYRVLGDDKRADEAAAKAAALP